MEQVLFILAAGGALAGAVGVVASRQPVRSALALLLVLGSLAVHYLLLGAQFIAILQVIIYAGAIVVLFLFVIMLLNVRTGEGRRLALPWLRPVAFLLGGLFLALLVAALLSSRATPPASLDPQFGTAEAVGTTLYTTYLLPVEVASLILLVGIIAAVVLGKFPPRRLPLLRVVRPPVGKA